MEMVPITELDQTANLMNSADYKDRFRAEYAQIVIRTKKLEAMLDKWDAGDLGFTPTCPRDLYDLQLRAMKEYKTILLTRACLEGVVV